MFHAAHQALDLADVGAVEERMSEGRLRARWAAWQRELNAAPRYVADELEATHHAHHRASTDSIVWQARADAEADPLVRDELTTAAREAREQAEQLARLVEQLELADDARTVFLTESAVTRDEAERARVVAGLHGVNLDDHSDRVTAQEWLDAHLLAQLADEAAREITEDDVLEDTHAVDRHAVRDDRARPEVDAIAPDIREVSLPDPTERADPAVRRRVPPPDAAAAALDRANVLIREVAERRQAEQAAAAYAAEQEPEEDQLRAELARQATYDRDGVDVDDDGEVLDRAM